MPVDFSKCMIPKWTTICKRMSTPQRLHIAGNMRDAEAWIRSSSPRIRFTPRGWRKSGGGGESAREVACRRKARVARNFRQRARGFGEESLGRFNARLGDFPLHSCAKLFAEDALHKRPGASGTTEDVAGRKVLACVFRRCTPPDACPEPAPAPCAAFRAPRGRTRRSTRALRRSAQCRRTSRGARLRPSCRPECQCRRPFPRSPNPAMGIECGSCKTPHPAFGASRLRHVSGGVILTPAPCRGQTCA